MLELIADWYYPFDNKLVRRNPARSKGIERVLPHVTDWSLAVDGGAYVGGWSRELAERFGRVIAVEIAADNFACLKRNVPEAESLHACLGEAAGSVGYEGDKHLDSPVRCVTVGSNVPIVSIDSLNLPSCGLIKLDLQGYDTFALRGAVETMKRFQPVVVYEHDAGCYKRYGLEGSEAADLMRSLGATNIVKGGDPIWKWT